MPMYELETTMYFGLEPAEAAIGRLNDLGFARDDISVMVDAKTRREIEAALTKAGGAEGLAAGAAIGGVMGAILAAITATGSIVTIVGTGGAATPLIAGPLAAALAGLGAGVAGGGLAGGLIGLGIGEKRAQTYEQGLREGGILIAVRPHSEAERAKVRSIFARETTMGELEADPRTRVR
jgi:hypothetical protein